MSGIDVKALVGQLVPVSLDIAGTAKTTAVVHLGKTTTYDPVTDTQVESGGNDVTVQGIFYRDDQLQGRDVTTTQADFLVEIDALPSLPVESDTVTINSVLWNIIRVDNDPTNTIAILRLRI